MRLRPPPINTLCTFETFVVGTRHWATPPAVTPPSFRMKPTTTGATTTVASINCDHPAAPFMRTFDGVIPRKKKRKLLDHDKELSLEKRKKILAKDTAKALKKYAKLVKVYPTIA